MRIHILTLAVLTALAATQLHFGTGSQSPKINLVNKTSYAIQALYLTPDCEDESEELLKDKTLAPGQAIEVPCEGQHKNWGLYLGWNDDEEEDDDLSGLALVPGHTYAVVYDEDEDETSIVEI